MYPLYAWRSFAVSFGYPIMCGIGYLLYDQFDVFSRYPQIWIVAMLYAMIGDLIEFLDYRFPR